MDLTEAQWQVLKPLLTPQRRPDGRGRPFRDARAVFNGILWVLRTGAPWHDLPDRYPPYQTCHRRFQQWQRDGTLTRLFTHSPKICGRVANAICRRPSSTPASVRRKKGRELSLAMELGHGAGNPATKLEWVSRGVFAHFWLPPARFRNQTRLARGKPVRRMPTRSRRSARRSAM